MKKESIVSDSSIIVDKLTKKFGDFTAVNAISFDIKKGEVFGLLGPNGAGKTTTLSMLSTILKPTSGSATVNGFDIVHNQSDVRNSIGIVFQDQSLDEELTALENMDFHGRVYRMAKSVREKKSLELLKLVGLDDRKDSMVKTFSGGMKRRLEIARGLLHEPKVLFLDEPTLGLDPQTRNHLWKYISDLKNKEGITIILTTHYMDEADKLCDRIGIIDHGSIVAMNTSQKLKEEVGGELVTIKTSDGKNASKIKAPWITKVDSRNGEIIIALKESEKNLSALVALLDKNKVTANSISMHKPTLEDVFLHFTGKTIREQEASTHDMMRMAKKVWTRR